MILQKRNSLLQKYYWTGLRKKQEQGRGRKIGDNLLNMIKKIIIIFFIMRLKPGIKIIPVFAL